MVLFSSINKRNILPEFKRNYIASKQEIKPLLNISIPLTLSRLVGSITYFLEPIIFTSVMLKNNYSITQITIDYGILSSYVMPLLLMPSFISVSLSNYLIPNMGELIRKKKDKDAIKLCSKISFICLFIGFLISIFFFIFSDILLSFLYDNTNGSLLIKTLCFPFIIFYIETPIIALLNIYELSKKSFVSTVISSIVRIVILFPLVNKFGIFGVSFSTLISVFVDISLNLIFIFFFFKRNNIKFIN
jgi:stage V sporulation protein B